MFCIIITISTFFYFGSKNNYLRNKINDYNKKKKIVVDIYDKEKKIESLFGGFLRGGSNFDLTESINDYVSEAGVTIKSIKTSDIVDQFKGVSKITLNLNIEAKDSKDAFTFLSLIEKDKL